MTVHSGVHSFARPSASIGPARPCGFTLMELMVVVSLVGILMGLAIPSFRDFIRNSRLTAAANDVLTGLANARSEAVKRQLPVAICATSNPDATPPVCSGAWTSGVSSAWVVWVDADDDWAPDNNTNEPVLLRRASLDASIRLLSNNSGRMKYLATGFASPPAAGFTNSSNVALCDARGTKITSGGISAARAVLIAATGRARVSRIKTEVDAVPGIGSVCPP